VNNLINHDFAELELLVFFVVKILRYYGDAFAIATYAISILAATVYGEAILFVIVVIESAGP
jgi:hypothetical protein